MSMVVGGVLFNNLNDLNMKKIYLLVIASLLFLFVNAQNNNQSDQGQRLAHKMAQKMKDSLDLTGNQMNQIYQINILLHEQKKQAMISGLSRDSISKRLQKIENSRDSLYRIIIPIEKFEIYKLKKRRIVNNNQ